MADSQVVGTPAGIEELLRGIADGDQARLAEIARFYRVEHDLPMHGVPLNETAFALVELSFRHGFVGDLLRWASSTRDLTPAIRGYARQLLEGEGRYSIVLLSPGPKPNVHGHIDRILRDQGFVGYQPNRRCPYTLVGSLHHDDASRLGRTLEGKEVALSYRGWPVRDGLPTRRLDPSGRLFSRVPDSGVEITSKPVARFERAPSPGGLASVVEPLCQTAGRPLRLPSRSELVAWVRAESSYMVGASFVAPTVGGTLQVGAVPNDPATANLSWRVHLVAAGI